MADNAWALVASACIALASEASAGTACGRLRHQGERLRIGGHDRKAWAPAALAARRSGR